MQISGKIYRFGPADVAADSKAVNRSPALKIIGNALWSNAPTDENLYLVETSQVQPGSYFLDQVSCYPSPLPRKSPSSRPMAELNSID